jgi:hypothetical protein
MKFKEQIAAREAKIEEIKGTAAKDTISNYMTQQQRDEQVRHNKKVEEYQLAQKNIAAERAKYERENRPSSEDKLLGKIQSNVTSDRAYQTLAKKLQDAEVGSQEYYKILDAMRDIAITYYPKDAKGNYRIAPPPLVTRPAAGEAPEEAQGFWNKFLYGPKPTSPAKPTAVPFDQLPK